MLIPHAISMANVRKAGLDVARVEIEPDSDMVAQEAQVTNSMWTYQETLVGSSYIVSGPFK
jgi:hypothetical protein